MNRAASSRVFNPEQHQRDPPPPRSRAVAASLDQMIGVDTREGGVAVADSARRSIRTISKDMIRTFQTTVQKNSRSQQMMPDNAPVSSYVGPRLERMALEGGRIARSVGQSAIVEGVGSRLSRVNDKLGMICRSGSVEGGTFSMTRNSSDRGIYSSESKSLWGKAVSADIANFATHKVVPFFNRSNIDPTMDGPAGNQSKVHGAKVVSFDYQLMKDSE